MRIAMFGEHQEGHQHIADLSAALAAQGHDVIVHGGTVHGGRTAAAALQERDAPGLGRVLDGVWVSERPQVVHNHMPTAAPAALAVAARHGIPVVHTANPFGHVTGSRRQADRELARAATRVTTTCDARVAALVAAGVPRARISVVPEGVDVDHFVPEGERAPAGIRHRVVALGDTAPHAGLSTSIAALCGVPDAELVVAATATDELRRYAAALGVTDRVRFAGPVPRADLPALLRSADVVTCTPWREPCHGLVLEAMACGVAVVATSVGALADMVVSGVTGLLVPPRRPRALAEVLHRLLARPGTREQYGAAARDRAAARYAWDRIATETLLVYERAGAPAAAPPPPVHARRGQPIGVWH